ncbi:hypothetical protein GCM10028787_10800 [Brachybacterium horti]
MSTTTAPTADLLTLPETATYLHMSEKSLRWLRYTGAAPRAAKLGGRLMFRRSEVDAWINEQFEKSA